MTTYNIGGSLPDRSLSYIVRAADRELAEYLQTGGFCYILTARQMGKSSLKVRTMQQLTAAGVACAQIDLTAIGAAQVSAMQWYNSIADDLASQFDLTAEFEAFLDDYTDRSDVQRLVRFIETIVLDRISGRVVIFVDEIDKVISLGNFTDDFFGAIRNFSERRSTDPKYRRLSFVLLGVASPNDLIADKERTPFNIGREITLSGFGAADDLSPLISEFKDRITASEILAWTGGQPLLTQKVCQLAATNPDLSIAKIVTTKIVQNWEMQDRPPHLSTIADRLLAFDRHPSYSLEQYRRILESSDGIDDDNSEQTKWLKLSGLVINVNGKLQVANQIYRSVFDRAWIDRELAKIYPHGPTLIQWLDTGKRDDRLLLRGSALDEAIDWIDTQLKTNRAIGLDNIAFVQRSKDKRTDRKLREKQIQIERSENNLKIEQSRIKKLIRQLKNIVKVGSIVGLVLLTILFHQSGVNRDSQEIINFGINSRQIIEQYEFAPLASLEAAIKNAEKFKNSSVPKDLPYSTFAPQLALQKIVDRIQEKNEIGTYQSGINSIYYCKDGRIFSAGDNGTIKSWNQRSLTLDMIVGDLGSNRADILTINFDNPNCNGNFTYGDSEGYIYLGKIGADGKTFKLIDKKQSHEVRQPQSEGGVQNIRVTRDGKYLFSTGRKDGTLKKWSIEGDQLKLVWERLAHKDGIVSLNFDDNDLPTKIGTAGKDKIARIWDLNGNEIATLEGHTAAVNSINFCSNCQEESKIVTGSSDGTARLWSMSGRQKDLLPHTGEIRAVRFSKDGKLLATATDRDPTSINGSSVRIWNLESRTLITEFKGHQGAIESMRFNEQNSHELITSGQKDSTIKVWKIPNLPQDIHRNRINSVRFDPKDSQHFITTGDDGQVRWWRYDSTKEQIESIASYQSQENKELHFKSIRFHPKLGRKLIAVGDSAGEVRFLKIENDRIIKIGEFSTEHGEVMSMDWNYEPYNGDNNRYLLATSGTGSNSNSNTLKIWVVNVASVSKEKEKQIESKQNKLSEYRYLTVRFSKDGESLAVSGEKKLGMLANNINLEHNKITFKSLKNSKILNDNESQGKALIIFSNDSKSIAAIGRDGKIWKSGINDNLFDSTPIETYQAGTINAAFGLSDKFIATIGAGSAVRIWDFQGRQLADYRSYWGNLNSVDLSKDGKYILVGGDNGIPRVWRIDRDLPTLIAAGCEWLGVDDVRASPQDPELTAACNFN
jgi:WD40 repeat protein